MHTPPGIEDRYIEALTDLKNMVKHAHDISSSLSGVPTNEEREFYAAAIFSKIVSQGISLSRSLPLGMKLTQRSGAELWDISSACCLARAIMEAHDALAYIAVHPESADVRALRIKVWELHDKERRIKMLQLIESKEPEVLKITESARILREEILGDSFAALLQKNYRGKIEKNETPDFLLPIAERCKRSEISLEYYMGAKIFLSAYVHTHPIAVHQLFEFRAGDHFSLNLLSLPVRYTVVFIAKAIEGMRYIFGSRLPHANEITNRAIIIWCGIAADGVKSPSKLNF